MRAVVTGATGFIGARLVDRLLAEGHEVLAVTRDPARLHEAHRGRVVPLVADLAHEAPSLPEGVEAVFHAAADMRMAAPLKAVRQTTVDGTYRMLEAAQRARVGRFVHVSSQAVYGFDRHYHDADESTPMRPSPHAYCESKRLAEVAVWEAARAGLSVTVLRPGFVYGPGDRATLPPVAAMLASGQLTHLVSWGEFDTGCLHVDNLVSGLLLAARTPAAAGQAYHLGDGRILTIRQLVDGLCRELGIAPPRRSLPHGLVRALGAACEAAWWAGRLRGDPPLTRFLADLVCRNSGFSIAKARKQLGYVPERQWEEALPETAAWCRTAGETA